MRNACLFVIASAALIGVPRAHAQPKPVVVEKHRVVLGVRPTEAPPPPREEKIAPRPGFVWIGGHWDWKDGKWAWMAGRWEKERPGKKWRPARWEKKDKEYVLVQGDWEDGGGGPGVAVVVGLGGPTAAPPPPREEKFAPRPGFVYIPGRWDWKDKKWTWMPGRWEKERAGKHWRPARWELRGKEYALVDGDWEDGATVAVVVGLGPTEPPPQPREEKFAPRPGFVYIPGRWDWKNKKWEWLPGRWEKERAHKKWRPARWELRDKQYALVEGDWVDDTIAVGAPKQIGRASCRQRV